MNNSTFFVSLAVPIPTPVPVPGPSASNGGNLVQGSNAMSTTQGGVPVVTQSGVNQTMTPALQQTHLNQLNRLPQQQPVSQPLQNQAPIMKSQTVQQTLPQQTQPTQQAPQQTPSPFNLLSTDPNRQVPIQITLPAQPNIPDAQARVLTIHVPASALTGETSLLCFECIFYACFGSLFFLNVMLLYC